MSKLREIRRGDWRSKEFWELVDDLTRSQREAILREVGGSDLIRRKHRVKGSTSSQIGLSVGLSCMDFAVLLFQAGISAEDNVIDGYHLARYMDRGNYDRGNCRFITFKENLKERRISDSLRESASRTGKKTISIAQAAVKALRKENPGQYQAWIKSRHEKMTATKKRLLEENQNRYRESYRNAGAAARTLKTATMLEEDRKTLRLRLTKSQLGKISYPTFGWKTRAVKETGLTRGYFQNFLLRHPEFKEHRLRLR